MLGVNVRMDGILSEGTVLFEPREDTTHKVVEAARSHPAQAELHTRGGSQAPWGSQLGGRQHLRSHRPTRPTCAQDEAVPEGAYVELTEELLMGLRFLVEVMPEIGPRETRILGPTPQAGRGVLRRLVAPVDDHGGGRREGRAAAPRLGHLQPR